MYAQIVCFQMEMLTRDISINFTHKIYRLVRDKSPCAVTSIATKKTVIHPFYHIQEEQVPLLVTLRKASDQIDVSKKTLTLERRAR